MTRKQGLIRACLAEARTGLFVAAVGTVLGAPVGLLWAVISPKAQVVAQTDRVVYYVDPEGSAFIAADGWLAIIGLVAGAACAAAAFWRYRRHGIGAVLGLVVGGVAASYLAWKLGHLVGPESVRAAARTAKPGVPFSGPLDIRAKGVLLVWPLVATTVFLVLTAGQQVEEPELDVDEDAPGAGEPATVGTAATAGAPGEQPAADDFADRLAVRRQVDPNAAE